MLTTVNSDVPVVDPTEEALDQEGRTIAEDVRTMTPPSGPGYFGISRLLPFVGPTPFIQEPQRTPNPTSGYTPHLMVDYCRHVLRFIVGMPNLSMMSPRI